MHAAATSAFRCSSEAVIADVRSRLHIRSQDVNTYIHFSPRPYPDILALPPPHSRCSLSTSCSSQSRRIQCTLKKSSCVAPTVVEEGGDAAMDTANGKYGYICDGVRVPEGEFGIENQKCGSAFIGRGTIECHERRQPDIRRLMIRC